MKIYTLPLLLFVLFISGCRKSSTSVQSTMTINVVGDSTWTTTDVLTYADNPGVYITGRNAASDQILTLSLSDYREGNKIYQIDNRSVGGDNITGSFASYQQGGTVDYSSTGNITVTNSTVHTIQGTFDFQSSNSHITGTFTAPLP